MSNLFPGIRRALCQGAPTNHRRGCDRYRRVLHATLIALGLACYASINQTAIGQTNAAGPVRYPAATTASTTSTATPANPVPAATNPATPPAPTAAQTPAPAGDIRDIRGVISIPYEWLWAAYVLIGLVVAGLLYAAWRFLRRRAAAKAKLPFEIALERLEAARALMTVDKVREYAFAVSEIIRVYIEQRFGEKAARRTTEEFLSDVLAQTNTPLAQHRNLLEDFLNHCDLIKFARWGATERELESMHESARAFILETKPQPEPAQAAKLPPPIPPELAHAK